MKQPTTHNAQEGTLSTPELLAENERYAAVKDHPVTGLILEALHEQDARTYNGLSGDTANLATLTAEKVERVVRNDERDRLAGLLAEHAEVFDGYGSAKHMREALTVMLRLWNQEGT